MTEFESGFYFRIEPEFGIPFLQVYKRRVSRRWYQREFVRVGDVGLVHTYEGETPMEAAKRVLKQRREQAAEQDIITKYSDYTKIVE